jgi:hypothetical protein
MEYSSFTTQLEIVTGGVLCIAFCGIAGVGSGGNEQSGEMKMAMRRAIDEHQPQALIIDLRRFDYQFGDSIGGLFIEGIKRLGRGHVVIMANGETASALESLLTFTKLNCLVSTVAEMEQALRLLENKD